MTETKELLELSETTANSEKEELQREIEQLQSEITSLKSAHYEEVSHLRTELYQANQLAEDNAKKRDNCYNDLTEAKNTIDELNAKLAVATAPKIPVKTNVDGAQYIKPEKRAIYDVEYIGQFKNKYKAKFADTDESFEDFSVYKDAKYKEVTAEEAPSFRIVQESNTEDDKRDCPVEEQPVVIPSVDDEPSENTFREEEETIGSELAIESPSVVGSFITEERINSIETRLARVEGMLRL